MGTQKKVWKSDEDEFLVKLKEESRSWEEIAQMIANTSPDICCRRWERLQKS